MISVHSNTPRVQDDTLIPMLKSDAVPMKTLHKRYGPLLKLVEVLIGVVPNCDTYLEIWPPAFRTYNVLVPNFLDLPFSILGVGKAPKKLVGLGMYVASRAAECPYCSAHTCSFALRRGAMLHTVAGALDTDTSRFSARERATIAVGRSIARIPCELTDEEQQQLLAQFGPEEAEWVVFGMVMMGFLNKFMDTIGVELEASTVAEVAETLGETWDAGKADTELPANLVGSQPPAPDSLWTKIRIAPLLPKALMLDSQWQKGVPKSWPAIGAFLKERTGHDFPVLSRIRTSRVIRSIGTMLRENLNPETTVIGLQLKVLAGIIFCTVIEDASLAEDIGAVATHLGVSQEDLNAARVFALDPEASPPATDDTSRAMLALARAASPSPAEIEPPIVAMCRDAGLSSAALVELVCWISVLQMLHRLTSFFKA